MTMHSPDDKLTARELHAITGTTRPVAQATKLVRLGVPFRWTGRAVVLERMAARMHELLPEREMAGEPRLDLLRR